MRILCAAEARGSNDGEGIRAIRATASAAPPWADADEEDWLYELMKRMRRVREALESDPNAAVATLEKWRLETARNLGLEEHPGTLGPAPEGQRPARTDRLILRTQRGTSVLALQSALALRIGSARHRFTCPKEPIVALPVTRARTRLGR
jgi:hypothetical protein